MSKKVFLYSKNNKVNISQNSVSKILNFHLTLYDKKDSFLEEKMKKTKIVAILIAFLLVCSFVSAQDYQTKGLTASDRAMPTFFEKIKERMTFPLGWKDGNDPAQWREKAFAKAQEIMIPYEDTTPFNMEVIAEEDRETYVAQKVVFNVTGDSRVMALLLVPKGKGPFPAALMLHDHGSKFTIGKEKMVLTFGDDETSQARIKESQEWAGRYFSGKFPGDELAKRGYIVLSTDALGWGDRSVRRWSTNSQQSLASNMMNMGMTYAGLIAMEDVRSAEFLASLPKVDKTKVATVGFSMGAFRSWQTAALSDAVTAGVVDCWMATMKGLMVEGNNQLKGQSAFTMLHPFIANYLDYSDVAGLAAPKPMLFYAGEQDGLFPIPSVEEAFGKMGKIWAANNAAEKLSTKIWPKGHEFTEDMQTEAYDWLDATFNNKYKPKKR